jgi:hypothetical protein
MKIKLNFYKSISKYKSNSAGHYWQDIDLDVLPEIGKKFEYQDWMLSRMEDKQQKEFLKNYSFSVGLYYVQDIMEYDRATNLIDYSVFLIENIEETEI